MRVGFAGTPEFAAVALEAIIQAGFDVPLVLTQPDRPKGRGLRLGASPVRTAALRHALPVMQPAALKGDDLRAALCAVPLDVLVVAAYGLILPPALLEWPAHGCLNIHASLLPRWRGAAPIQRALLANDAETGITIMQMDSGLDTGPMIEREAVAIGARDTAGRLHDSLAAVGSRAIVRVLERLARERRLVSVAQSEVGATYAAKIERREAALDWHQEATTVERTIRAFNPAPGAFSVLRGEHWKVWSAEPVHEPAGAPPGTVTGADRHGIRVACGRHQIMVTEMQPAGSRRLTPAAMLSGRRLATGDVFGAAPT